MNSSIWKKNFVLALAIACLAMPATAGDLAELVEGSGSIGFATKVTHGGATLTVTGPSDFLFRQRVDAGGEMLMGMFDKAGNGLADGTYTWEIVFTPALSPAVLKALSDARAAGDDAAVADLRKRGLIPTEAKADSGYFTIANGALVSALVTEETDVRSAGPAVKQAAAPRAGLKDQVILDDLIVDGSACVGFDCVNGESFGFDTIRMKENNLRVKFEDTSASASFPSADWQLTANDSANGGANKFSIDDISGSRTPFTVEANAPSHSLYVDDGGRLGLGTSIPVANVHAVSGNTPTVRLEQNGSSGFAPQTWDLAGNETSFFIRDASNGSTLPFRVRPGAPSQSLVIDTEGQIGMGVLSADKGLHIQRSDGTAGVLVRENSSTAQSRNLAEFINNGKVNLRFEDTNSGNFWRYEVDNRFIINHSGDAVDEMELQLDGDMIINGTLTENSDRTAKLDIVPVDTAAILEKVTQLPISHWAYKDDPSVRHIGPMAQDFFATFEVGETETGIAAIDRDGVALAAIQALARELQKKNELIQKLEERVSSLEAQQ